MIGILFNSSILKKMFRGTEKKENLDFYLELAREKKVNLCLYSPSRIREKKGLVRGYVYNHRKKTLIEKNVPIPKVNLCRTILHHQKNVRQLKRIEKKGSILFLNVVSNRQRNKYTILRYLQSCPKVRDHVPVTAKLSYTKLPVFLNRYRQIIIKPKVGSLGEGIYKLAEKDDRVLVQRISGKKQHHYNISKSNLKKFYNEHFPRPSTLLMQQWVQAITYHGKKLDIRTSVQKNGKKEWAFTGIVPRLAGKQKIVTNVAQGGKAVPYHKITSVLQKRTKKRIRKLSLNIAKALEQKYPSTADLGLDIAVDRQGKLWFLEANYRDQRISYRDAGERGMWKASYRAPFEYAYAHYHSRHLDS